MKHAECRGLFCEECIEKNGKEQPCAYCRKQRPEFHPNIRSKITGMERGKTMPPGSPLMQGVGVEQESTLI